MNAVRIALTHLVRWVRAFNKAVHYVAGLALLSGDTATAVELVLVWVLVMFTGATAAHLLASRIAEEGIRERR